MIESLGALGGYGITSVIVIIVAFFLFARFVKKIIGNIIMGGLLFWLLNTIGITHMTLTTMHGIVVALFGVPGTIGVKGQSKNPEKLLLFRIFLTALTREHSGLCLFRQFVPLRVQLVQLLFRFLILIGQFCIIFRIHAHLHCVHFHSCFQPPDFHFHMT